jgi:hypothetical protein
MREHEEQTIRSPRVEYDNMWCSNDTLGRSAIITLLCAALLAQVHKLGHTTMEKGEQNPAGTGNKAKRTRAQMTSEEARTISEHRSETSSSAQNTAKGRSKGEEYLADMAALREEAALATPEQRARLEEIIERERTRVTMREHEEQMIRSPMVEYDEMWGFDDTPTGIPDYEMHCEAHTDRENGIPSQIQEEDLPAFFERVRRRTISRRRRGLPEYQ